VSRRKWRNERAVLSIKPDKDKDGLERVLFTCDEARPAGPVEVDEESCPPYRKGASVYLCGRRLRNKRPKENREDGCPGGYMACDECAEVVSKFLDEAHNAKAVRKEWL
jgi:hypothetical protein